MRLGMAALTAIFACAGMGSGCSGARPPSPAPAPPPPAPPLAPPPALAASAVPPAPVASEKPSEPLADVGRFRLRLSIAGSSELACGPDLVGLQALPNGQAWVTGSCGIRVRVDAAGKVEDFRAPWKLVRFNAYGNVWGKCPSTAFFWGIWARSENEAYVVGDTRCGLDPNTIWYRPLEKFDGKKWIETKTPFGAGPHEGIPDRLAGNDKDLYTLIVGDDWHGPPECAVHRYSKGKWEHPILACPQPKKPGDRVMVLSDLRVTPEGTLFVVGKTLVDDKPVSGMIWMRAQGASSWTEIAVDDVDLLWVSVAADGSVWAAGKYLWRKNGARFERMTRDAHPIFALWAESASRVWFAHEEGPRVWADGHDLPVAMDSTKGWISGIAGSKDQIWAITGGEVYHLDRNGEEAVAPSTLTIDHPTDADYPKQGP